MIPLQLDNRHIPKSTQNSLDYCSSLISNVFRMIKIITIEIIKSQYRLNCIHDMQKQEQTGLNDSYAVGQSSYSNYPK